MKASLVLIVSLFIAQSALGEVSAKTQTLLIKKLTNVFLKLPDGNATKTKITLRLADLHAERGRLVAKQELEKGCIECSNGESDRKKALEYYLYVLPNLKGEQKHNVLVQTGHIYEVLGRNDKAIKLYKEAIASGKQGKGVAESLFSLGEIYFKQRNYSSAGTYYAKALGNESFTRRGLASYRLAWCQYNTGKIAQSVQGLERILTTPKLLTRGGEEVVNVDQDFKAEVAKDFTVFVAHSSQLNSSSIQKVYNYSPEKSKIENVSYLAKELERLGRIKTAQETWELVVSKTGDPQIRMEGLVYLAGLQLKGAQKEKIAPYLKRAFQNWNSLSSCKDQSQCDELKKRIRRLVFDWNRSEKKAPSQALLESYEGYFSVAPKDMEALELASQAASQAKNFPLAYEWNQKSYKLTEDKNKKEALLLRRIEISELAKNDQCLLASQKAYLAGSPTQAKASDIRYQMAQKSYDNKEYAAAAEGFKNLVKEPTAGSKVRLQAAEMALDTLVLLKKDAQIESWATEFASLLPKHRKRFTNIASKSVLSQTAKLSQGDSSSEAAWSTLNRFNVSTATNDEKITFYKNKVILARKLKKYTEMSSAIRSLMALKGLSAEDSKFALENKVWVSELQLNFAEAFASYKKLNTKKWLELARLADLAEKPSEQYYLKYLKGDVDKEIAFSICVKLIKDAGKISGKHKSCIPYMQTNKDVFASLILEIYSGKLEMKALSKLFAKYGLSKAPIGFVITRSLLIDDGVAQVVKLNKHKLDGRPSRVGRSLKRRLSLITKFERVIAKATDTKDWMSQTLFLSDLQAQYMRFYEELLSLPTPKDLTDQEQQEYLGLLSQQAAPYKEKADEIQHKLAELWKNNEAIDQIYADFHSAPVEVQAILGPQIDKVKAVASEEMKPRFDLIYKTKMKKKVPSFALLETARQQVKSRPLDKIALKKLIELETARGYQPMIIYLNSRLKSVDNKFESKVRSM